MKKMNNFQIAKVQPYGVASVLLYFFANFNLALLIKVLLIKKACMEFSFYIKYAWKNVGITFLGAHTRLLSKHFCLQPISRKIQFLCLLSLVTPRCGLMVDTEGKIFLKFRSLDRWKRHFSWIFLGILKFNGKF